MAPLSHHLVSSPSLFPTLLSETLLAWLAAWVQVRPTHVPVLPASYQCVYKLKWPCSMGPLLRLRYPSSFLPTKDRRYSILELIVPVTLFCSLEIPIAGLIWNLHIHHLPSAPSLAYKCVCAWTNRDNDDTTHCTSTSLSIQQQHRRLARSPSKTTEYQTRLSLQLESIRHKSGRSQSQLIFSVRA